MTAVFVHGNPETAAVWRPLLAVLDREDVMCLSPPGFGAPLPSGFGATVGGIGVGQPQFVRLLRSPATTQDAIDAWRPGHPQLRNVGTESAAV
jgi:pimeloyl-ACP methyl ester carboxylesterase